MTALSPLRLFVTVGTDVHPFDRLLDWVETAAADLAGSAAWLVQHGHSAAPRGVDARDFLGHREMQDAFASSQVIISHGGPTTIAEARRHGVLPLVIPRRVDLGEHVDDHQVRFARRLADERLVRLVEDETTFRSALQQICMDPESVRVRIDVAAAAVQTSARFGTAVAHVFEPVRLRWRS